MSEDQRQPADNPATGDRTCPWCGSGDTRLISRGYAGLTDETDQYSLCGNCGRKTYELIAKTARDMRLGRYRAGDVYTDRPTRTRYTITRVLRVGTNEFLVYLKPLPDAD